MRPFGKFAVVLGIAGAIGLAAVAPSEARGGRNAAAIAAGVGGFALGAAIGSAAANNAYYGPSYGYYDNYAYAPGYAATAYSYEPAYTYSEPAYTYSEPAYVSGSYYGPVGGTYGYYNGYNSNSTGPWHNRTLNGRDW